MRGILLGSSLLVLIPIMGVAEPVATVGGQAINRTELENHVRPKLVEIENERFEVLRDGLDELIAVELFKQEAKARGVTVEVLEQKEVESKLAVPSDDEIQKVYDANKDQLNDTLENVKPRIVEYLKTYKTEERRAVFVE